MKSHSRVVALAFVIAGSFTVSPARAQKPDTLTRMNSEGAIAPTGADTTHKKKGMFSKLKSVAQNKTVQNVTKAAVCTAVPGGQYLVGAADAAQAKSAGRAAGAAAGAAVGGGSCIPGLGGMGTKAAVASAGMSGAGMGAPGAAGITSAMAAMAGGGKSAPGAARAGVQTAQQVAAMQAMQAQMQSAGAPGMTATAAVQTEAPGEQLKFSGMPSDEIKKGKLTIKKIDWVRGGPAVSPSTATGFSETMANIAQAMKASGATYRVDVYMDKKYSDAEIESLGMQRTNALIAMLLQGGLASEAVMGGKIGKDKEQKVEIVKVK